MVQLTFAIWTAGARVVLAARFSQSQSRRHRSRKHRNKAETLGYDRQTGRGKREIQERWKAIQVRRLRNVDDKRFTGRRWRAAAPFRDHHFRFGGQFIQMW